MLKNSFIIIIGLIVFIIFLIIDFVNYKHHILSRRNRTITMTIVGCISLLCVIPAFAKDEYTASVNNINIIENKYNIDNKEIRKIGINKVIIVGDSRMEYIERDNDKLNIPENFEFIAKSGATITWTKEVALPTLLEKLEKKDNDYKYHVIFNMGVNDLRVLLNTEAKAKEYYNLYKQIIEKYSDVDFYLLSVNPIVEDKLNKIELDNKRTNEKIQRFNGVLRDYMIKSNFNNLTYCNSYADLDFSTPDGLHYDLNTNQKIINYISNNCVNYK